jgi:hypothetical protein
MFLFHGSTVIVDKPQIITTEYGRDFGAEKALAGLRYLDFEET